MHTTKAIPKLLIISGSDSSGGAGMQADINMARYCGVYPLSVISCITAQSILGLEALDPVDIPLFKKQIECCLAGDKPSAVKVGMLPSEDHLKVLIDIISDAELSNIVVDPVFAPTLGYENMSDTCWKNPDLVRELSPLVDLLTPNIPECRKLNNILGHPTLTEPEPQLLIDEGFKRILLKGGHSNDTEADVIVDRLYYLEDSCGDCVSDTEIHVINPPVISNMEFYNKKILTPNTHGTGCNLSTAIASLLARGLTMIDAIGKAEEILNRFMLFNCNIQFSSKNPLSHGPVAIINPAPE